MNPKANSHTIMNYLILAVLTTVPLCTIPVNGKLETMWPKIILLAFYAVFFLYVSIRNRREIHFLERDLEHLYLFGYVLLAGLATLLSVSPTISFWGSTYRHDGFLALLLYTFAYLMARNAHNIEKYFFKALTVTSVLVSLYAILQFYKIDPVPHEMYQMDWVGLAFSTMGNPNFLGSYLTLSLPIPLYLYFYKEKRVGLFAYMILFLALLATRTRGAWIGSFMGLLSFLFYHQRTYGFKKQEVKRVGSVLLASFAVLVFFMLTSGDTFLTRFLSIFLDFSKIIRQEEGAEMGGSYRVYLWGKTLELIRMKPLIGHGLDTMYLAMNEHFRPQIIYDFGRYMNWDKAHNEYLNIAVSSGIPSLLLYLAFLRRTLAKGYTKLQVNPAYIPVLASVTGYLVQALFNIQVVMVYYVFLAFVGILSGKQAFEDKRGIKTLHTSEF